jgi:hypothetical protein
MHIIRRYVNILDEAFFEAATNDLDTLTEANRVFRLIAAWLREHGANAFFYQEGIVDDVSTADTRMTGPIKVVKLTLSLNRVANMPEEYKDLSVVLTNMEQTDYGKFIAPKWGGHYYSHYQWHPTRAGNAISKVIVLYVPKTTEIHVGVFEARMSSIFTHEFVHYLDDKRIKPGIAKGHAINQHVPGSHEHMVAYINDPIEFNAYYMQGIRTVIEDLDRIIRLRRDFPLDFRQFLHTFTVENNHFNGDFRTLMNDFWRRKFIKRLKGFHEALVKRYRSGEPYTKLWWDGALRNQT